LGTGQQGGHWAEVRVVGVGPAQAIGALEGAVAPDRAHRERAGEAVKGPGSGERAATLAPGPLIRSSAG
jgi:hypothetical protein